jgi:hypothetical protein
MAGPLTAEQMRELRKLWWTPSVRRYQVVTLAGLGILLVSWAYLMFVIVTVPLHSGITAAMELALVLLFVGVGVMAVGIALRGRATRKIAYRMCPSCNSTNLWLSEHCSKCGAALPRGTTP